MEKLATWCRLKSPWILHINAGGCNGCDIEILAALTPRYDVERFGILLKPSPRHADVMVIAGVMTRQIAERVKRIYEQMPEPKFVIAVGACALTGGVFQNCYGQAMKVDQVIPVDVYVPGCPPKPEAIIDGVVKLLGKLKGASADEGRKE